MVLKSFIIYFIVLHKSLHILKQKQARVSLSLSNNTLHTVISINIDNLLEDSFVLKPKDSFGRVTAYMKVKIPH